MGIAIENLFARNTSDRASSSLTHLLICSSMNPAYDLGLKRKNGFSARKGFEEANPAVVMSTE